MTTISALLALNISLFLTSCSHYAIFPLHLMCLRGLATPLCLLFNIAPRVLTGGRAWSRLDWDIYFLFYLFIFCSCSPTLCDTEELHRHQPEASGVQSLFSQVFTVIIMLILLPMAVADVCTCAHLSCTSLPQFLHTKVIVLIHHRHHVVRFGTVLLSKMCPFFL